MLLSLPPADIFLGCHFTCARANSTRIRYVSLRCTCDPNILTTKFLQWRCEHSFFTCIDSSPDVVLGLIHGREAASSHKRHRRRRGVCQLFIWLPKKAEVLWGGACSYQKRYVLAQKDVGIPHDHYDRTWRSPPRRKLRGLGAA